MGKGTILIESAEHAAQLRAQVAASAARLQGWIAGFSGDGLELLRALKFDQVGLHPLDGHALNAIEQVNQTWTYLVAFAAVGKLLELHPEAGGFSVAPGARKAQPLDVMSVKDGLVGAEVFAAVDPKNNGKLTMDLTKLTLHEQLHRYVFFAAPGFPGTERRAQLERDGIQVWSVDV